MNGGLRPREIVAQSTPARSETVRVGPDVELRLLRWDGHPPGFVMVHGLASNARLWQGVSEVLCDGGTGHAVAAIDLRGHGESGVPASGYDTSGRRRCSGRRGLAPAARQLRHLGRGAAGTDPARLESDWASDTLSSDAGEHARDVLRSMIVELGDLARPGAADPAEAVRPYVDLLVSTRARARDGKNFTASDEIRDALTSAGVELRDTPTGPSWSFSY